MDLYKVPYKVKKEIKIQVIKIKVKSVSRTINRHPLYFNRRKKFFLDLHSGKRQTPIPNSYYT